MTGAVTRHAPGKLFIVGEYAVMTPGTGAILAAVDRRVTVTAAPSPGHVLVSDVVVGETRLRPGLTGVTTADDRRARGPLSRLVSAIRVVGDVLTERGAPAPPVRLSATSELHEHGTKFGLGSSGAVMVAAVSAYAAYCGLDLTDEQRYRLALIATARIDPRASGGDLAAGVWGGWLEYRAPDREAVLDDVRRHGVGAALASLWPGFGVRGLPRPASAELLVGWTGTPVATGALLSNVDVAALRDYAVAAADCVRSTADALDGDDLAALLDQVRTAQRLMRALDRRTRAGIFTAPLTALCEEAAAIGGAGKPSGAGGGDCGIAVVDATAPDAIAQLRSRWSAVGIRPLPVSAGVAA